MKPAAFDYYAPTSMEEACSLLSQYGDDAKILAGGQSLVPVMALRLAQPSVLIDINRISALDSIQITENRLHIGAITRHCTVERSPLVREKLPLLAAAIEWIGHPQIRHRGTIGGSLAHADPAAELPAIASALDATFMVANAKGEQRTIKADEFFVAELTSALDPDDLLCEVSFALPPSGTGWSFVEVARRHGDFALVGVAATVALDATGKCSNARVALLGVAPTAVRASHVEQALSHQTPDEQAIAAAATEVTRNIDPPADLHGSAEYRRFVATNLVRRALTEAVQRAQ